MTPQLPQAFRRVPLAHRALHDVSLNRPENSRAAISAAIAAGYGIEIDLQLTAEGRAMVFHDYDLERLTGQAGPLRNLSADQAQMVTLLHSEYEGIPSFREVLGIVAGQVPLLVELKDQDGAMGPAVGALEQAVADDLAGYRGPVAVMSFNPHSVEAMARLAPSVPRGLVTGSYDASDWPLPADRCAELRKIPDFDRVEASFISHEVSDLNRPRVAELKTRGIPILCWTVRSPQEEAEARKVADNITFEGYTAEIPG